MEDQWFQSFCVCALNIIQVCLWHLDMDTYKMTCFAKLVVPREEVLPPDILCSMGVLRREKAPDDVLVPATPATTAFSPRPKRETEAGQREYGRCRSGMSQQK